MTVTYDLVRSVQPSASTISLFRFTSGFASRLAERAGAVRA